MTTADLAVESTMRALLGVDGEAWDLGSDTLVAAASPRTHGALLALMPDVA